MSNKMRASFSGRLMIIITSLGLLCSSGAAALAQTQVVAGRATAVIGNEKKGSDSASPGSKASSSTALNARPAASPSPGLKTGAETPKPAVRAASTLRTISVKKDGDGLVATIELDGQASFNHFTLTAPHRLVVDVRSVANQASPLLSVGEQGIQRIRTGNFEGSVRIVFDTVTSQRYQISREDQRILVRFPGKPEAARLKPTETPLKSADKTSAPVLTPPLTASVKTAPVKSEPVKTAPSLTAQPAASAKTAPIKSEPVKAANKGIERPLAPVIVPKELRTLVSTKPATLSPVSQPNSKVNNEATASKPEQLVKAVEKPGAASKSQPPTSPKDLPKEMKVLAYEAKSEKIHSEAKPPGTAPKADQTRLEPKPLTATVQGKPATTSVSGAIPKINAPTKPVTAAATEPKRVAKSETLPISNAAKDKTSGTIKQPQVKAQPKPETVVVGAAKPVTKTEVNAPLKANAKPTAEVKIAAVQSAKELPKTTIRKDEAALFVRARMAVPINQATLKPVPIPVAAAIPVPAPTPAPRPTPVPMPTPVPVMAPAPTSDEKMRPPVITAGVFKARDYTKADFVGEAIKLDLKSVDLREILRFISDTYKVNFVVDKSVGEGVPVTVSVEEVPWNQALDSLLRSNRLGVQVEGNILRVMSQSAISEEDDQRRKLTESRQQAAPLITEIIRLNYAKAGAGGGAAGGAGGGGGASGGGGGGGAGGSGSGLDVVMKSRLSPRGKIEPDPRTNTLVVTDIAENLTIIKEMIKVLDVPEPQVEIEARIVIANRSFARDLGVQLGAVTVGNKLGVGGSAVGGTLPNTPGPAAPGSSTAGSGLNPGISDILKAAGASTVLALTTGIFGTSQISAILSAAESKGNVKTISTPRITAQNNQTASVVNGVQIPVQTESNNTVTVSFVTAALKLEITPQITAAGTVLLKVVAENNSVNLAIATKAAPGINTQKADTTVLVPDGGTTIIGGINIETESQSQQRTPGVSRIPGLGELFKRRTVQRSNDEILFFITPRIYRSLDAPQFTTTSSQIGATPAQK